MEIAMSRQTKNEIFETLPTKPVHVAGNSFRRASVSDLNPPLRWSSAAERLWSTAEPLGLRETPATTYLEIRGGAFPWPNHLRYYPKLAHRRGGHVGPALLAMVTNATTGEKMTLQATWLAPDGSGKAQITPPRKCLFGRQTRGGTVRLTDDDEATMGLGIAEGIEDALSIMNLMEWRPVWSALGAAGIRGFPVLDGIECLTIFADPDKVGREAAESCCGRWREAGREANIATPRSGDWNEYLVKRQI